MKYILSNRNVKNMKYVGFMLQETKTLMHIVPEQYLFCHLAAISSILPFVLLMDQFKQNQTKSA